MKGVLEFDLPEDDEAFRLASRAVDYERALSAFKNWLRGKRKHTDIEEWPDLNEVWDRFHEILNEHGIEL